jgi:hypothetical protein
LKFISLTLRNPEGVSSFFVFDTRHKPKDGLREGGTAGRPESPSITPPFQKGPNVPILF